MSIVFHEHGLDDYLRGGRPPPVAPGFGLIDITIGELDEAEKRRIARGVAEALAAAGIPDEGIGIHFRHVTGRDVAEGGGRFPFRPDGAAW